MLLLLLCWTGLQPHIASIIVFYWFNKSLFLSSKFPVSLFQQHIGQYTGIVNFCISRYFWDAWLNIQSAFLAVSKVNRNHRGIAICAGGLLGSWWSLTITTISILLRLQNDGIGGQEHRFSNLTTFSWHLHHWGCLSSFPHMASNVQKDHWASSFCEKPQTCLQAHIRSFLT